MKKIVLVLFLCPILFAYGVDVQKITQKIDKLKNFKISHQLNYKVYDPFATAKPILKKETIVRHIARRAIVVETILNHKAFIDGSWHSSGGYIHGVKIIKVLHNGILVARENKKVLIPLKKEKNIIIKTKEYVK